MTDVVLDINSERYYFKSLWGIEPYEGGEIYLYCDEIEEYTFVPYEGGLRSVLRYNSNKQLFNQACILLIQGYDAKLKKVQCTILEETKEIYIAIDKFNQFWGMINSSIYRNKYRMGLNITHDTINNRVNCKLLEKSNRTAFVNGSYKIEYKGKEIDIETQRMLSKRANALNDKTIRYIYSKSDNIVHDRDCKQVELIPYWDFECSSIVPPDRKHCPMCKRKMLIRNAVQEDISRFAWYEHFFEKKKIGYQELKRFLNAATIHMENANEMHVKCNEDKWIIVIDKQNEIFLYHNNYIKINDTERKITTGYHRQKNHPDTWSGIIWYITKYSWEKHLENSMPKETVVTQNAVEIPIQKVGLLRRIINWFSKKKKR